MTPNELPLVLTVPEAGKVLRISRNTAYAQAKLFRESGGREGLPVFTIAGSLRVHREALVRLLNGEPVATITAVPATLAKPGPRSKTSARTTSPDAAQLTLVNELHAPTTARDAS